MANEVQQVRQNNVVPIKFNKQQIELIKRTVAKGATNDELAMFLHLASAYNLDPFKKEIWFIKRAKKRPDGTYDYNNADTIIMTSRDGYLKCAKQDPGFDGLQGFVVREGDTFEIDAENFRVTHKFGTKRGKILGAWAAAYHKERKPCICFVDFEEYYKANSKSNVWQTYPSAMILKVAEVFVLKRQFDISGLVSQEELSELDQAETMQNITPAPTQNVTETALEDSGEEEPQEVTDAIEMCTDQQAKALRRIAGDEDTLSFELEHLFGVIRPEELTKEQASKAIKMLQNQGKKEDQ